jgi:hypothetical protein
LMRRTVEDDEDFLMYILHFWAAFLITLSYLMSIEEP